MTGSNADCELPDDVRHLLRSGECVAYLGSGLSAGVFPSWPCLVNDLCAACGCEDRVDSRSPSKVLLAAAECARKADCDRYHDQLGKIFGTITTTNPLYSVLLQIPFKSYITVNFDPLLANETRNPSSRCRRVMKYPDLDRAHVGDCTVYYLHGLVAEGDAPVPGTIVLAQSEFDIAYAEAGPVTTFLLETFKREAVCFIGCSLEEPPLAQVFRICRQQQEEITRLGGGSPPPRHIFRAKELVTSSPGTDLTTVRAERIGAEDAFYSGLGIGVVRYDPIDAHHNGLRKMLEDVAELPGIPLQFGFGQMEDLYGG